MSTPLYAAWSDNILLGSVVTASAGPSSTYSLETLLTGNPAERVLFGAATTTVTFTLTGSSLGQVLVIPMHNLTPGSSTVLHLTNAAGLNQAIPIPALEGSGFPPTLIYDLSALANLTSGVWHLVITSNASNVQLGGAIAIYPKKTFTSVALNNAISWQFKENLTWNMTETPNEYATPYIQDYGTISKQVEAIAFMINANVQYFRDWFLGNHGRSRPGLFWPDPDDPKGAYHGRFQKTLSISQITSAKKTVTITFDEWPKGELFV